MIRCFLQPINKQFKSCLIHRFSTLNKDQPKSSLFISGERAIENCVVVIPHLDFEEQFSDLLKLGENINRRNLNMNVYELKDLWNFYNDWIIKKVKLEESLKITGNQLTKCFQMEDSKEKKEAVVRLERIKHLLKEDLHQVKKNVWNIEDNVIGKLLNIPNKLHPESPENEEIMYKFCDEIIVKNIDHLLMGYKLDSIEYRDKFTCFLKNKAAEFELAVQDYFICSFSSYGFIRFSNPDFTRSVLSEGVGLPPKDSSELFLLEQTEGHNDQLQLCGGASVFPFCGFLAKHTVSKKSVPLRFVAAGRCYSPLPNSTLHGLYAVHQSTCVQIFVATCTEEQVYSEFQYCINKVCEDYKRLGLNFKVLKKSPRAYKNWESLQVSILVFSPFFNDFIEVGNISLIDDYVSKRLRMCFTDKTEETFLRVVTGKLVNIQTLLALCLERSHTSLFIPEAIKNYMLL